MTDVVIVGAGHNGLVCAAQLARAGCRVQLLEAAAVVGGAAVTREFAAGFRVPAVAHLLYGLDDGLVRDLELQRHGFALARRNLKTVALNAGGAPLVLDGAHVLAGDLADADRAELVAWLGRMRRFAGVFAAQNRRTPPRLAWEGLAGAWPAARLALDVRRLGREEMREFLRIVASNMHDVLEESFANPLLKGALAVDGVLGAHAGPRSGNTVLVALQRLSGMHREAGTGPALVKGGVGALSDALAAAARAAGVAIRTGARVQGILLDGDRVRGVRLADGEEIAAATVVSNADPRSTLLGLLGARHLEAGFARRLQHVRMKGSAAKLHLALSGEPRFANLAAAYAGERLLIAPDTDYIERAFNHAKYREFSPQPVLELTVPSLHDPGLAPPGRHVLSAVLQYAPYELAGGWEQGRARLLEATLDVLERYAPGLRGQVLTSELLTPADIEREFGIGGGHWHHGELALDQFLMLRPVPGAAQYATPVPGLYLCGAGCHPGGGIMGHAGRNAARAVLAGREGA